MIELVKLKKKYGDYTAVDEISLRIEKGELFGLLGPNGAGKSTIVSMLSTVLAPTSGDIIIAGKSLSKNKTEIKKMMGIVPQDLALYQSLSAEDNLRFFGALYGLSGKKLTDKTNEVLKIIQLEDKAKQDVSTFSGGMKRRVNIGVALMNSPQILILDEPTVAIDPQSRNNILETVKMLNKEQGMTVIYTSHYMEEVEFLCKRVGIVDFGKLIALGNKEELKKSINACDILDINYTEAAQESLSKVGEINGVEKVSIGGDTMKILVSSKKSNLFEIIDNLKELGIKMTSFKYEEVNLESIFLNLTGKSLRE